MKIQDAKKIYNSLDKNEVPKNILKEIEEIKTDTNNFSDQDLFDVFKENFIALAQIIKKNYTLAIPLHIWPLISDKKETTKPKKKTTKKTTAATKKTTSAETKTIITPGQKTTTKKNGQNTITKTTKSKNYKSKIEYIFVDHYSNSVRLLRSFKLKNGKELSQLQFLNLYQKFEKEIVERKIRKDNELGHLVIKLRDFFKQVYTKFDNRKKTIPLTIKEKTLSEIDEVIQKVKILPAVRLLKRFVSLLEETTPKEKILRWKKEAENALQKKKQLKLNSCQEHSYKALDMAINAVTDYVNGDTKKIAFTSSDLSGINGNLASNGYEIKKKYTKQTNKNTPVKTTTRKSRSKKQSSSLGSIEGSFSPTPSAGVINSYSIEGKKETPLPLNEYWKRVFGAPSMGFSAMFSARAGGGKTTLALNFAKYYAANFGKTLYVSFEQIRKNHIAGSLKELIVRRAAQDKNLDFAGDLPSNLSKYGLVVVDSVTTAKITPDQVKYIIENNPKTNFIFIYQQTKEGTFKGSSEHLHNVDMEILIEKGKAYQGSKNRFRDNNNIKAVKIIF